MARPRIRSIDTNPRLRPSRLLTGEQLTPALRFAKCATVVTELYSEQLRAGEPIPGKAWWVRFVPTDAMRQAQFDGVPFSDGMGEVHEVPYNPSVLDSPATPSMRSAKRAVSWLSSAIGRMSTSIDIVASAGSRSSGNVPRIGYLPTTITSDRPMI